MGFFDKVKGILDDLKKEARRKEQDRLPNEEVALKYKNVPAWLDSVSKPFLKDISIHLSETIDSLAGEKQQLEKDIQVLTSAKIEETHDKRMERAVVNNRKALLSRLNIFCNNVRFQKDAEVSKLFDCLHSTKKQMNSLMIDTTKNFYFVSSGIPTHCEDVKKDLFEMSKSVDSAIKYLEPLKVKIKSIDDSKDIIEEIDSLFLKNKEANDNILSGNKKLKELLSFEKTIEKKLKDIEKGSDIKKLNDLNEKHSKITCEINGIKGRIIQTISPVSRALRKYSRVAQLGGKDEEHLLELYIDDPVSAVNKDENMKLFKKVIGDVELHVSRGSITLKDKLKSKTISAISNLRTDCELSDLKKKLQSLDVEEKTLSAKIRSDKIMKKKEELEHRHTKLSSDIDTLKSDISEKEKSIKFMTKDIKSQVKVLESKLSSVGNYNVKVSC